MVQEKKPSRQLGQETAFERDGVLLRLAFSLAGLAGPYSRTSARGMEGFKTSGATILRGTLP